MPYISSETVKSMRTELRKRFPEFKFSVTRYHHSSVNVNVLSGPIDFGGENVQVNHFYIDEHWKGESRKFLKSVYDVIRKGVRELVYDGDYGSVPTYYTHIEIGKWDRPYEVKHTQ
jgi:hypothetical protein